MRLDFPVDGPAFFARFFLGLQPYPWQDEAIQAASLPHSRTALVAANGSGKTACVNVALLLWFLWKYPKGIAMVTSGSWNQLKTQLWPNLEMYRHRFPHWKWQLDKIRTPEGGFIAAYSTIHPGRAEGHHEHLPERPVMLMVDEAKSVPEVIFEALSRCTPTFFVLTSSPGKPSGTFYQAFRRNKALWHTVQVNAYMCPHIRPERIELARQIYGEEHPVFRSMILGEFTEGDDAMMIPRYLLERALLHPCKPRTGTRTAAVDWAAGGDETVLAERYGNQLRILWCDREKDTVKAARKVVAECRKRGIEQGRVFGDECGIGLSIMQSAQHYEKFRFRSFNGGSKVPDPQKQLHFLNLNAYSWHLLRQGLERGEVCFPDGLDDTAIDQLCDRYMEWNEKGVIQLEKKDDMKERGLTSPDRADALVMAWYGGRFTNYDDTPVERADAPAPRFVF
jgi:hypothetical protein